MLWDPFLIKKLLKSVICGTVNSTHIVNNCGLEKKKKKKKGKRGEEISTWVSAQSKRSQYSYLTQTEAETAFLAISLAIFQRYKSVHFEGDAKIIIDSIIDSSLSKK